MQRDGNPEGGRFKGLHLQALQKRVHGQAEWLLGKVQAFKSSCNLSLFVQAFQGCGCAVKMLSDGLL